MSHEMYLQIEVEYLRNHVPRDVDDAIHAIMRDAARRITAKLALLSDPRVVSVKATTFVDDMHKDLLTDESHPDSP